MPDHGGNATPRASPKDSGTKDSGPKTPAQIELTPIESLLFFNMVRFNSSHDKIDWNLVASHSNLKNAASAKVRFRQILKKHGLMAHAPETPRSQAQKRKAASKSDDEDGDSSYNPSNVAVDASARKRSARGGGGRAKRQRVDIKSEDDQDNEQTVADSVVVASAPTPKTKPDTKTKAEIKTETRADVKAESEPRVDTGTALLSDDGMAGGIDGTDSASPRDRARGQAPQGFSARMAHFMAPDHRQSALPANMGEAQMMQLQPRHPVMVPNAIDGNDPFTFGQQLNPHQLAALHVSRAPQLQLQQMTAEQRRQLMVQAQAQLFDRFEAIQMFPYQMYPGEIGRMDMPGGNLPFGHMTQMHLNNQFPADNLFNRGGTFFDQSQLGHDAGYGNADDESPRGMVDGQDEWDVESDDFKREVTPEIKNEDEAEGEQDEGDEVNHGHDNKLKLEEI